MLFERCHIFPLVVAALAAAAAGCTRENVPRRVEDRGDEDHRGAPPAQDSEVARSAQQPLRASELAQGLLPALADIDESRLRETAQEYLARRGEPKPFQAGEIAPSAIAPVVSCVTCHGAQGEGIPQLETPRIGGMAEWYLARQLKYFHQGVRAATIDDVQGTQMRAVLLASLTDAEGLEGLARYFATFDPPAAPALESGDAAKGEQLFAICVACHGADGKGSAPLNTPSLVEQNGDYLVRQLENFRTGVRGTDPRDLFGQQMRPIAASVLMSRQDAVDVVSYIATLRDD